MSAFDDWLAAKDKSRDAAAALDEILWLRTERQRLRLTDAEREAVKWAVSAAEDCQHPADDILRGLLERLSGSTPISGAGQSTETGKM